MKTIETQEKLDIVRRILDEKKAENVEILDVSNRTLMADYFVVCNGTSNTHIKAIADGLIVDGKQVGLRKDHAEGYAQAKWILVDYGDIIVHIFAAEEREYYDLESLWKATEIKLEKETA
ncbi:MAG: ribosome silencing factor [Armatimonadota bacterium]